MTLTATRALRPVYCAIEHLHREMDVAREACAGRFRVAGALLVIDDSTDWCTVGMDGDRERWIEWSKFYFGIDIAFAFSTTGDVGFLRAWEKLVTSWFAKVPVDVGPTDALGRRLQNWIYAANLFTDAPAFPGFSSGFADQLIERIASHADYLQAHLTPERNHRTLELYALFLVSLALPPSERETTRRHFAWNALQDNLLTDFRSDGVHREHSTHYHMIVLRSFLAARENARQVGLQIPERYDAALRRALRFAAYCHRPDGSMPALSDSDIDDYSRLLEAAADALHLPDVLFVGSGGRRGRCPLERCADFCESGYFVQRSSFEQVADRPSDHRHLVFDCGALGDGGHGHYDSLSIDVWCGRPLLVDPGRYTYDPASEWRQKFKGTAAHNTVCIDGRDQTAYRPGKPRCHPASRLLTRYSSHLLDVVGGEVATHEYNAIHRRHVFFIAHEYWVVLDQLEAATPHDYDLRFHLSAAAEGHTLVGPDQITAPGVRLLFGGPGSCALESGWVAPQYGVRVPAPVVSRRSHATTHATFVTAILPLAEHARPAAQKLRVVQRGACVTGVVVEGGGASGERVDRLEWTTDQSGAVRAALEPRSV